MKLFDNKKLKCFVLKNKTLIILVLIVFFFSYFLLFQRENNVEKWSFIGYQYKWSDDYVENSGFKNQLECINFGEIWLNKQKSQEAMFTCSQNCKPDDLFPGAELCAKICEFNKEGFQLCRE
ncbi:MAG: hypothetical protein ABH819_00655 [Patescibacteria group bacterium]